MARTQTSLVGVIVLIAGGLLGCANVDVWTRPPRDGYIKVTQKEKAILVLDEYKFQEEHDGRETRPRIKIEHGGPGSSKEEEYFECITGAMTSQERSIFIMRPDDFWVKLSGKDLPKPEMRGDIKKLFESRELADFMKGVNVRYVAVVDVFTNETEPGNGFTAGGGGVGYANTRTRTTIIDVYLIDSHAREEVGSVRAMGSGEKGCFAGIGCGGEFCVMPWIVPTTTRTESPVCSAAGRALGKFFKEEE